jgi:hypothetical protein
MVEPTTLDPSINLSQDLIAAISRGPAKAAPAMSAGCRTKGDWNVWASEWLGLSRRFWYPKNM